MSFTSEQLFRYLMYSLRSYPSAVLLHYLLEEEAEKKELRDKVRSMAKTFLRHALTYHELRGALRDLEQLGLVETRVLAQSHTTVRVNAQAVLDLLATAPNENLPAMKPREFAFLRLWQEASIEQAARVADAG